MLAIREVLDLDKRVDAPQRNLAGERIRFGSELASGVVIFLNRQSVPVVDAEHKHWVGEMSLSVRLADKEAVSSHALFRQQPPHCFFR